MGRTSTASALARSWAAIALALALAGCGTSGGDQPYACPAVSIVGDLSILSRFGGPTTPPDEQAFYGEITGAAADCDYGDTSVDVTVSIATIYDRPPGRPASNEPIEYFVAMARPDGTVIGKQTFDSTIAFREGEIRAGYREDVQVTLPLPEGAATGPDFTAYVGFQLSESELDYNRQRLQ